MTSRWYHWPIGASVFAGVLGAGILDAILTAARSQVGAGDVVLLAVGLYGTAGLGLAVVLGWAAAIALGSIPGGARALVDNTGLDERIASGLVASAFGALALAAGAAVVQGAFVGTMASRKLAVLAMAGLTLGLCPVALVLALAARRPALRLVRLLPRPKRVGRTGLVLGLFVAFGMLAAAAALSRADWRVLDLGPIKAAGLALMLGIGHGLFWYASSFGRAFGTRLPRRALQVAAIVAPLVLMPLGARLPDSSPAFQAGADESLGLRLALGVARAFTDRDGDGHSSRFGGGDCNDTRADVFPGAEDVPGDGIDQNCEGGDARQIEAAVPSTDDDNDPGPLTPAVGAFAGNILIISIDSLRSDRLGVAGYGRPQGRSLTPTLDTLAKRGAYFRRVWSQAPNTPRSFPSFLTSRYPSEIAWQQRSLNYSPILPSNETFFEILARAGWKLIGIFSHFYFTADRGLSQGFAEWSNEGAGSIAESNKDIPSPRIVPKVIERLRRAATAKERFVLWTHLFEPHASYLPHADFPTKEKGIEGLEEKYDFEIAFVDGWIGKIIAALKETELDKNTAVVILADHGEAWGEHRRYFHGHDLTEEQLRVPLIIALPDRPPAVIDDDAALVDLGPTLVDLVGAPIPASFRGRSLLPRLEGRPLPARPVFAELLPANAWPKQEAMMVFHGKKITHRITDRRWELHDLMLDPKQQRNLGNDPIHQTLLEKLRVRLLAFEEGQR